MLLEFHWIICLLYSIDAIRRYQFNNTSWCHPAGNLRILTAVSAFTVPKWNGMWYLVKTSGTAFVRHDLHHYSYLFIGVVLIILFDVDILHFGMLKGGIPCFQLTLFVFTNVTHIPTIFLLNEKFGIARHRLHFRFSDFIILMRSLQKLWH